MECKKPSEFIEDPHSRTIFAYEEHWHSALAGVCFAMLVLFGGFYFSVDSQSSTSSHNSTKLVSPLPVQNEVVEKSDPAQQKIFSYLNNPELSPEELDSVMQVAGLYGDTVVLNALFVLSKHPNATVRASIVKTLAAPQYSNRSEVRAELLRLLDDPDYLVRGLAAKSLARIGTPDVREALLQHQSQEHNEIVQYVLMRLTSAKPLDNSL